MSTPTTFAEAQSRRYGTLVSAAGIAIGIGIMLLAGVLVYGGWPATLYGQIVAILGYALGGAMVILLYVIHIIGIGGPLASSKLGLNRGSLTLETTGD